MPGQVFQVVQCYSCHTFQVQQRKKVNKWVCKMCGEKQSIKKVYGEGSGADCRVHVQKLNTLRGEMDHTQQSAMLQPAHTGPELGHPDLGHSDLQYRQDSQLMSRWGQFMDDTPQTEEWGDDDGDNDHRWTTDKKMFKESIKQSKKRKKSQGTFSQHSLKGDNPFSSYTSQSVSSWDNPDSYMNIRDSGNSKADDLCDKYQSTDDCHLQLPDQRLRNHSKNNGGLSSDSVKKVMTSVVKKQKTSNQDVAVRSKWSNFIDNEESDDSDCSESTMRFGRTECNPEHDSSGLQMGGQTASSMWSVFVDSAPSEPPMSQEGSHVTEPFSSSLRSNVNVSGANMTCYHGYIDEVIGQSVQRELSQGHSHLDGRKRSSKTCDNNSGSPEQHRANTGMDRCGLEHVEGKENRPHLQTSSMFSVGDVDDADLEIDF
ncbi:uncharacterized protein LOC124143799 [Haliotis rufescens]|uniref:uncharacterized protein LOC124143799 n=1 Tax=Haliotis rufescens TaxID=6454 RepID=UPI00201EFBB5|nr:uncharacterized protein LOC124143799 [Haliotis rufescens]